MARPTRGLGSVDTVAEVAPDGSPVAVYLRLPAGGDLMVFGGRFQADYLHGVPKVRHAVRGRISAQWRYTTKRGRPEMTPGYYAPREFSKSSRARR